jgi:hypothetical protein
MPQILGITITPNYSYSIEVVTIRVRIQDILLPTSQSLTEWDELKTLPF